MAQQGPRQRGTSGPPGPVVLHEVDGGREGQRLEAMMAALARGAIAEGAWEALHADSRGSDRIDEFAFAFDSASQGKRYKALSPVQGAEFLFQAGRYFADVMQDEPKAIAYFERALSSSSAHAGAFAELEDAYARAGDRTKLAELCMAVAASRPRTEQVDMLRRAARFLLANGTGTERVAEALTQVVRLDPTDDASRESLEQLLMQTGRFRDLVRLTEQALAADPAPAASARAALLSRLVELHADKLNEPERALPFVEQLLALDPAHASARRVAERLISVRGLAARAAAALANAHEAKGRPDDVVRYLGVELESTRGPKRAAILGRIARLRELALGDPSGAFEAYEQALALEADDELRSHYTALAVTLERTAEAAKTLTRLLGLAKDAAARARTSVNLAEVLLHAGDFRRAKPALNSVLAMAGAPDDAVLTAARRASELARAEGDQSAQCSALERAAPLEPDPVQRKKLDEQLAEAALALGDWSRAIPPLERLLATDSRAQALEALEPLYAASGEPLKRALLLEERSKDADSAAEARALAIEAATIRAEQVRATQASGGSIRVADVESAVATATGILTRFGPAIDALAILIPLLEVSRKWPELANALSAQAALTEGGERAQYLTRLAVVQMQRLGEPAQAVFAFAEALSLDPRDRTARAALEKLSAAGDHRVAAARALEPWYRREGARGPLLRALELRGALGATPEERTGALLEAVDLAGAPPSPEPTRALDLVGRGLGEVVRMGCQLEAVRAWIERLDRVAPAGDNDERRAAVLSAAVADLDVASPGASVLLRIAAEALSAAGHASDAVALYRRALAFSPSSLASRQELLHRVGFIESQDLADPGAAIATFRAALDAEASDEVAAAALEALYTAEGRFDELARLLEEQAARGGQATVRATRFKLARLSFERGDSDRSRAHVEALLSEPDLSAAEMSELQRTADALGDDALRARVIERRLEASDDGFEQVACLDALGDLYLRSRDQHGTALATWRRAGELALSLGQGETAVSSFRKVRAAQPENVEVTSKLLYLCELAERWDEALELCAWLAERASGDERVALCLQAAELHRSRLANASGALRWVARAFAFAPGRVDVLATFQQLARGEEARRVLEEAIREALCASVDPLSPEVEGRLRLALAGAISRDESRCRAALDAYRAILDDPRLVEDARQEAAAGYQAVVAALRERDPAQDMSAERRWLLSWWAAHASDDERPTRWLAWARAEETDLGDIGRALDLYEQVLSRSPDDPTAVAAIARLALTIGDVDRARAALEVQCTREPGAARLDSEGTALAIRLLGVPEARERARELLMSTYDAEENAAVRSAILTAVLRANPTDNALWDRAEDVAREHADPEPVAALYEEQLERADGVALAPRAVRFYEEWFEDSHRTVGVLERAVQADPGATWAFDRLKLLLDAEERWDDLFRLYDRMLEGARGAARTDLLRDAAQSAKDFAGQPERAIEYLEDLRRELPGDQKLGFALERLYERVGNYRALSDLLAENMASREADDQRRLALRVATLRLERLADPSGALSALESIVAADVGALTEETVALLERVVALGNAASRGRAAGWLRQQYAAAGEDVALARMLAVDIDALPRREQRARRHVEIADLYDRSGERTQAFEHLGRALVLTPEDEILRARMEELADRISGARALADVLVRAAEGAASPLRAALTIDAAVLFIERLAEPGTGFSLLSSLVLSEDVAPQDALKAARRLEPLLVTSAGEAEQLAVLERMAALENDAQRRKDALGRAARLAALLSEDERALALWEQRFADDTRDTETLASLVDLCERLGLARRLVEVLGARAEGASDPASRRRDLASAAHLLASSLGEPAAAIDAWRNVEREFGEADDAGEELEFLYGLTERWHDLSELLLRRAEVEDLSERASRLRQLGDLRASRIGDAEGAVVAYRGALTIDPHERAAREGLHALADHPVAGRDAIDVLLSAARAADDWDGVLTLLPKRIAALDESEKDRASALWLELARAREARRIDAAGVLEAYMRARDAGAGADAAAAVIRVAGSLDRWDTAAEALALQAARRADAIGPLADIFERTAEASAAWDDGAAAFERVLARDDLERSTACALNLRLSNWHRDRRGDPVRARAALERALERDADTLYARLFDPNAPEAEAIEELAVVYEAGKRWNELLGLRERQLAAAPTKAERVFFGRAIAQLLAAAGDLAGAAVRLRGCLDQNLGDEASASDLDTVLARLGDHEERRALLAQQATLAAGKSDAARSAELWARAAEVAERELGDVDSAAAYHARAVAMIPRPSSLDALARLATARGEAATAAEWLARWVATVSDPPPSAVIRLADALEDAGRPAEGAPALVEAIARAPEDDRLRERLLALYQHVEDWPRLARATAEAALGTPDEPRRVARLVAAADLFVERCDAPHEAVPLLAEARETSPDDLSIRLSLANALLLSGRGDEAAPILHDMLHGFRGRRPRERARVHDLLAKLHLAAGDRSAALRELEAAVRGDLQNLPLLRAYADLALREGQLERAERAYRALLVLVRRDDESLAGGLTALDVLVELAALASLRGEHERARELFESAVESADEGDRARPRLEAALRARIGTDLSK